MTSLFQRTQIQTLFKSVCFNRYNIKKQKTLVPSLYGYFFSTLHDIENSIYILNKTPSLNNPLTQIMTIDEWQKLSTLTSNDLLHYVTNELSAQTVFKNETACIKHQFLNDIQELHHSLDYMPFSTNNIRFNPKMMNSADTMNIKEDVFKHCNVCNQDRPIPEDAHYRLISNSRDFTQFIAEWKTIHNQTQNVILLDAEDIALHYRASLSLHTLNSTPLYSSIIAAKLDSAYRQFVVFIADILGNGSTTILGIRDIRTGFYWDATLSNIQAFEILYTNIDEKGDPLIRLFIQFDNQIGIQDVKKNGIITPVTTIDLLGTHPNISSKIEFDSMHVNQSKDQRMIFISAVQFKNDINHLLQPKYYYWIYSLNHNTTLEISPKDEVVHLDYTFSSNHPTFFEHHENYLILFESINDSYQTIKYLNLNDSTKNIIPTMLWNFTDFHIDDIDCIASGVVMFGHTEIGRPELRLLLLTDLIHEENNILHQEFKLKNNKLVFNLHRIYFLYNGTIQSELLNTKTKNYSNYQEEIHKVNQNVQSCSNYNDMAYAPSFNVFNKLSTHMNNLHDLPFYGELYPDFVIYDKDVTMVMCILVPELHYTVNFSNTLNVNHCPSITLTHAVYQNLLPLYPVTNNLQAKTMNQPLLQHENTPSYLIERHYCPTEKGDVSIPLTVVRAVYPTIHETTHRHTTSSNGITTSLDYAQNDSLIHETEDKISIFTTISTPLAEAMKKELNKEQTNPSNYSKNQFPERWEDTTADMDIPPKCLLFVYGSSGLDPTIGFSEEIIPLLKRNWTIAVAHVRGGASHSIPYKTITKQTYSSEIQWLNRSNWGTLGRGSYHYLSVNDLRDVCFFLIAQELAGKGRIALRAASAGAIIGANILNTHPDLFGAIMFEAPFLDLLTTLTSQELLLSKSELLEWGNPMRYIQKLREYRMSEAQSVTSSNDIKVNNPELKVINLVANSATLEKKSTIQTTNPAMIQIEETIMSNTQSFSENTMKEPLSVVSLCPYTNISAEILTPPNKRITPPWIYITTSVDDTKVPLWQSIKWLCRHRIRQGETNTIYMGATHGLVSRSILRLKKPGSGGHCSTCKLNSIEDTEFSAEANAFLHWAIK